VDTETPQSNGGGCMSDGWILDIDARLTADEKLSAASGAAVNGAAGSTRALAWESTGSLRWQAAADMTAESGSNAGSNFSFAAHPDAGALIGVVDTIARASRVLDFKLNPTVNGLLAGALPNRQISTASGTWTKPADYPDDTPVLIECWGGGGIHSAGNGNAGGRPSNVASYDNHFGGAQGESAVSHKYTTTTTDPDWSGYGGGGSNQPGGTSSHGGNGGTVGTNNAAPSLAAAAALNQGRAAKSA
jgi:hypothetical protein